MTHKDALNEMAVERYLLGELSGKARDRFETHLFECTECATDVKEGALFLEAAGTELRQFAQSRAEAKESGSLAWLWQGWVLGPVLAACLAVIVYQSAFVLPRMRTELAESRSAMAEADTPALLTPLVLANAGARGGAAGESSLPEIVAPRQGFYLLSVDIPSAADVAVYRCTLYSLAGNAVWHVDVSPQQAHDAVTIQVPVATAKAGINELRIEGIPAAKGNGERPEALVKYRYKLSVAK